MQRKSDKFTIDTSAAAHNLECLDRDEGLGGAFRCLSETVSTRARVQKVAAARSTGLRPSTSSTFNEAAVSSRNNPKHYRVVMLWQGKIY
jgi:hypothetical protein